MSEHTAMLAEIRDMYAKMTRVAAVIEWASDKEADWAASRRADPSDQYAQGARDVCEVVVTRLRAALADPEGTP